MPSFFQVFAVNEDRFERVDCDPVTPKEASIMLSISDRILAFVPFEIQKEEGSQDLPEQEATCL